MYAWAYLCPPIHMCSSPAANYCINANLHGKLPPMAPNVNALAFIVSIGVHCVRASIPGSLHATPHHSMCIFTKMTKIYDMLNKNS